MAQLKSTRRSVDREDEEEDTNQVPQVVLVEVFHGSKVQVGACRATA